jgi:hypothetical protein
LSLGARSQTRINGNGSSTCLNPDLSYSCCMSSRESLSLKEQAEAERAGGMAIRDDGGWKEGRAYSLRSCLLNGPRVVVGNLWLQAPGRS